MPDHGLGVLFPTQHSLLESVVSRATSGRAGRTSRTALHSFRPAARLLVSHLKPMSHPWRGEPMSTQTAVHKSRGNLNFTTRV